ncbi:hypothetical protein SGFS_046640 [Streptomyces graminofaciens]|uniref:Uncharacterized protein n=1 Tax=Streptomyces graminofaciens TaxID=68212 RepID=A0ABN5VIZ6_9ACTN|nr:hypothetical protein [Streptomyces graminofaciens]BBC33370.1 hypothetical protein SGFS_046640 [Streptomyces graminofaciens]
MSVARRASSTARRSLLTATAAGTLLCALWFVPSANATQDETVAERTSTSTSSSTATGADTSADTSKDEATEHTRLADTGSPNTTPYIIGGTLCLALGAGFVAYSVRQGRVEAY